MHIKSATPLTWMHNTSIAADKIKSREKICYLHHSNSSMCAAAAYKIHHLAHYKQSCSGTRTANLLMKTLMCTTGALKGDMRWRRTSRKPLSSKKRRM